MRKLESLLLSLAMALGIAACAQDNSDYLTEPARQFSARYQDDPAAYLLDVRTPGEYDSGHIAGAANLDWLNQQAFSEGEAQLPRDRTIYVYCRSGGRSAKAARKLALDGYRVVNLDGGYQDLESVWPVP